MKTYITVHSIWEAKGPGGQVAYFSGPLNVSSGASTWTWPIPVRSDVALGMYTFSVSVTYNGQTSSQTTTFEVRKSSVCPDRIEATITAELTRYIEKACFDPGNWQGAGVQLFLTDEGDNQCSANIDRCTEYATFVVNNLLWRGNRPLWSVIAEIKYHADFPESPVDRTYPMHIEYNCADLGVVERPLYGC